MHIDALDLSGYDSLIDKIAQDLADGKIKPHDLSQELITKTYYDLAEGTSKGVGNAWTSFDNKETDRLVVEMRKNIYTFASAKSYAQLQTLNQALFTGDGKIRPFNEYSQIVKKVNNNYNKNWLQAEYQTARTAGQMAMKWQKIQEEKDLFPNLRYRTVGDDRVRDEHEILNGIIKPIDDPFWATKYPPLAWRCRCDVVQTAQNPTGEKLKDLPKSDFDGNVGMDGEIFTKNLKFFKLINTDEMAVRNAELAKLNAPMQIIYKNAKTGKKVERSIFYDHTDYSLNLESAKIIVDELKSDVIIRPHVNLDGFKNPEYLIGGKLGDRKSQKGKGVSSNLNSSKIQGCKIVVFDIHKDYPYDINRLTNNIKGNITKNYNQETFDSIIIIDNGRVTKIEVKDWYK